MDITCYQENEKTFFSVYADKSTSNGILRFGHEINVVFVEENGKLKFYSAWHIGVSDMEWNSEEEESFEATFPGLLEEMRKNITENR